MEGDRLKKLGHRSLFSALSNARLEKVRPADPCHSNGRLGTLLDVNGGVVMGRRGMKRTSGRREIGIGSVKLL